MKEFDEIEVRSRFEGLWVSGFQLAEVRGEEEPRFVVRRSSDGVVLPSPFSAHEVREAPPGR